MRWKKLQGVCQAGVEDFYGGSPYKKGRARGTVAILSAKG